MAKKDKKKATKKEEVKKELTFAEKEIKKAEAKLAELEVGTKEYDEAVNSLNKLKASKLVDLNIDGKEIVNENLKQETKLKKKEINAGVAKTAITTVGAVAGCAIIPIIEQKVGPAISKVAGPAMSAMFKKN